MIQWIVLVYVEGAVTGAKGPFDTYAAATAWAKTARPGDTFEVYPLQEAQG